MNLKLPLEVEVPDELRVDDYTLTCKQVSEWEAVYRNNGVNDHYSPYINIDLSAGSIRGEFLGKEYSDSFDVTGDYLYENLLSMAEEMSKSVNKKSKKSTPKTQSFSDMVKKQRNKSITKSDRVDDAIRGAEALRQIVTTYKEVMSANLGTCRQGLINAPNSIMGYDLCTDLDKATDKLGKAIDNFNYELGEIIRLKEYLEEEKKKPFDPLSW